MAADGVLPDLVIVIDVGPARARRRVGTTPTASRARTAVLPARRRRLPPTLVRSDPERLVLRRRRPGPATTCSPGSDHGDAPVGVVERRTDVGADLYDAVVGRPTPSPS